MVGLLFPVSGFSGFQQLDSLRFVMTLLAIFLLIAIDAIRQSYIQQQTGGEKPTVEARLEEIAAARPPAAMITR